ncbi:MAG: hypothetical protein JWP81_1009 [Ferruginibacter sp.]|nr:hypothetical protein [Ferruginibacter sp.]
MANMFGPGFDSLQLHKFPTNSIKNAIIQTVIAFLFSLTLSNYSGNHILIERKSRGQLIINFDSRF